MAGEPLAATAWPPDAAPAAEGEVQGPYSRGYRAWLLFLLTAISALNLADRQGLAALAPALKRDLTLSDTQLGFIEGIGVAFFFTVLALPVARLADRSNRIRIVASAVAVFALFSFACSRAVNFVTFLLARIGVGCGLTGFSAPVASLIGDHYPPQRRAGAITIMWLGGPIGAMAGAAGAGWIAQHYDWRWWFIGLSIPSAIIALLVFLTLREPERGLFDAPGVGKRKPPPIMAVCRFLLGKRSMVHVMIGVSLASMGMNGIGQFLARYLVAAFDLGTADAGQMLGLIGVVGMASGLALGGFGSAWLARRDRRWYVWGAAIGLTLTTPLFLIAFAQTDARAAVLPLLLGHITLFVYYTPSLTLAQNMVDSSMRASASFLLSLVLFLIGVGLGPTLVGFLSDRFAGAAFPIGDYASLCPGGMGIIGGGRTLAMACEAASDTGITRSMMVISLLFVWAAVHYLLAARHLEADLDRHYQPAAQA